MKGLAQKAIVAMQEGRGRKSESHAQLSMTSLEKRLEHIEKLMAELREAQKESLAWRFDPVAADEDYGFWVNGAESNRDAGAAAGTPASVRPRRGVRERIMEYAEAANSPELARYLQRVDLKSSEGLDRTRPATEGKNADDDGSVSSDSLSSFEGDAESKTDAAAYQ